MKSLKKIWSWILSFEISLNIFGNYSSDFKGVPEYYFDDSLSDREKLNKDWEMIGNDFKKIIR